MIDFIRLSTVHPALVHFTIGALPLLVIGYGVAAARRSARWTFAADVTLVTTAAITIATAAFGLASNAVVPWPGGLALWRWLHLGFGLASATALLAFAAVRLERRRRAPTSGVGAFAGALAIALGIGFTGWIGGEVLVYRAGMAVRAAGEGALAPPAVGPKTPKDLLDAMDRLRASWAAAETTTSSMIVQRPRARDFASVEGEARRMAELADWIAREGPASMPNADQPSAHHEEADPAHAHEHGHAAPMTVGEHLSMMAGELEDDSRALARAAHEHDLVGTARLVGTLQAECADCHTELRWPAAPPKEALR